MTGSENRTSIICIGAGAAGLFFALNCAGEGNEVLLIDGNARAGRKMYISGKGRCNITNDCDCSTFISNVVRNPRFLYSAIRRFTPEDTISFFNSHGCPVKTERGNRVFPVSDKAADIIDCLVDECKRRGVKFCFDHKVREVRKDGDGFIVLCKDRYFTCDRLVIATGGMSYPGTGSTGDGYRFAEAFGHTVIEPKSALCPIKIEEKIDERMYDLTLKNVELHCLSNDFSKSVFGDLEFVQGAISGPIALSMSSLINRLEDVRLWLDLKPALDEETLDRRLLREISDHKDMGSLLKALLPQDFLNFFIRNTGTDEKRALDSLTRQERQKLLNDLKHFDLTYKGLADISQGIVTSGGVDVRQIDPRTMESKLCEGLYFIGEVLDVDAYTGGFSLQSALSTGYVCARAMNP